jgi:hypothetical protein
LRGDKDCLSIFQSVQRRLGMSELCQPVRQPLLVFLQNLWLNFDLGASVNLVSLTWDAIGATAP